MTISEADAASVCARRHHRAADALLVVHGIPERGLFSVLRRRRSRLARWKAEMTAVATTMSNLVDWVRLRLGLEEDVHLAADVVGLRWIEETD